MGWADSPPPFFSGKNHCLRKVFHDHVLTCAALVISVVGIGYRQTMESILSSAVLPSQMATLFVAISVVDTFGVMITSSLLPLVFREGMHLGGLWIGLPFFAASGLYVVISILTGIFKVPKVATAE